MLSERRAASGERCAICDQTNATTRLCEECALSPYNVGWSDPADQEKLGVEMDVGSNERVRSRATLQDIQGPDERAPTALQRMVVDMLIFGALEAREYRDRCNRRRGTRLRVRSLRVVEIARIAGCHENYVLRIRKSLLHGQFKNLSMSK